MNDIGMRVKSLRQQRHMTQETLAELASISVTFVSAIENNHKIPSLRTLDDIANALGVALHDLVSEHDAGLDDALWMTLMADCTEQQKRILFRIASATKEAITQEA